MWTPETPETMARVSDEVLAVRLGRSVKAVQRERTQRGIRFRVTRRWTEEEDHLVRTLSVDDTVRATDRSRKAILKRRWVLGLPGLGRKRRRHS